MRSPMLEGCREDAVPRLTCVKPGRTSRTTMDCAMRAVVDAFREPNQCVADAITEAFSA